MSWGYMTRISGHLHKKQAGETNVGQSGAEWGMTGVTEWDMTGVTNWYI